MNGLEIAVIIGLLLFVAYGLHAGLVRMLAALLSLVLSVILISASLPYMTAFLREHTPLYETLKDRCSGMVTQVIDSGLSSLYGQEAETLSIDTLSLNETEQIQVIQSLKLPEFIKEQILDGNTKEGYRSRGVSTFLDYLTAWLASLILNILAFVITVLLVTILIRILIALLRILAEVPGISLLNRLGGGIIGLVQGLCVLWLFFLLLTIFQMTTPGQQLLQMVWKSDFLNPLYDLDILPRIVLRAAALF